MEIGGVTHKSQLRFCKRKKKEKKPPLQSIHSSIYSPSYILQNLGFGKRRENFHAKLAGPFLTLEASNALPAPKQKKKKEKERRRKREERNERKELMFDILEGALLTLEEIFQVEPLINIYCI